jgi:thymidylate synthase
MDTAIINIQDGINGYVDLVQHVLKHGKEVAPRGQKTREIEDAIIRIEDVTNVLPMNIGRGTVPGIGAVEACQLLSGTSFPDLVIAIGPQFKNYVEDNGIFHGAYGPRTNGQFDVIIDRLRQDPDTRQAVVTIWNPQYDLQAKKRDYPCTILHQFRIRDNKLNMSVYMRSNDVWLGAAYDFFQFTRVQLAIASVLGIEPGTYNHHVGSLHIYEQHYEVAENLKYTDIKNEIPAITGRSWNEVKSSALLAMQGVASEKTFNRLNDDEKWYASAMIHAVNNNLKKAEEAAAAAAAAKEEDSND